MKEGTYRPDQMFVIPSSLKGSFFTFLLSFLSPYHHLSAKELQLTAAFIKKRYELGLVISDAAVRDKVLFSNETKKEIRKECGITIQHFQVMMSNLRKKGIFKDNNLNPKFIPEVCHNDYYDLLIRFKFEDEQEDNK